MQCIAQRHSNMLPPRVSVMKEPENVYTIFAEHPCFRILFCINELSCIELKVLSELDAQLKVY